MKKIYSKIVLLAAVAKAYGVGDTVFVHFKDNIALNKLPQSRVVQEVRVLDGTNIAEVTFTSGEKISDGATTSQRVYTTQVLCANAMIDAVILDFDACAVLNTTTSGASIAAATTLGLVRSNT